MSQIRCSHRDFRILARAGKITARLVNQSKDRTQQVSLRWKVNLCRESSLALAVLLEQLQELVEELGHTVLNRDPTELEPRLARHIRVSLLSSDRQAKFLNGLVNPSGLFMARAEVIMDPRNLTIFGVLANDLLKDLNRFVQQPRLLEMNRSERS